MNKFLVAQVLFLAVVLSACGGGEGLDTMSASVTESHPANGPSHSASAHPSWLDRILAVIGTSLDTAEPVAIGDVAAEHPEESEPAATAI